MRFTTLDDWLNWQMTLHPCEIDLGLQRCQQVAHRLGLLTPRFPIISVAGTNGKGSSVALLDAILSAQSYRVGRYMSPHLIRYHERIGIGGQEVNSQQLCEAFAAVDEARQDLSLTYFEFGTLAAMWLFQQNKVDMAVLEVGLGGRLDAVNVFNPTVALITTIDIDHTDWLGPDRDSIGFEKAGILRAQQPAVCSDPQPPASLIAHAQQLGTPLYCLGRDFNYTKFLDGSWRWESNNRFYCRLPPPNLPGDFQLQNASGVLMALTLFGQYFPVSQMAVRRGLTSIRLPGRFQVLPGKMTRILDVAHNPSGARVLREVLAQHPCSGQTHALVGILKDKDILGILTPLQECVAHWHVADLNTPRSAESQTLVAHLQTLGVTSIQRHSSITAGYRYLLSQAVAGDRIVVFGSFYTVAEVLYVEGLSCG